MAIACCAFFMPGIIPASAPRPPILPSAELRAQIVHVELTLGHFALRHLLGVFLLDRFGSALDQADHVAHAEDAAGDALGMEGLERIELFAGAGELDRLAGDGAHRQRRTAARIAVHAGQHDAGQRHLFGEALRDVDRVLAGQRVDDEQDFVRLAISATALISSISA